MQAAQGGPDSLAADLSSPAPPENIFIHDLCFRLDDSMSAAFLPQQDCGILYLLIFSPLIFIVSLPLASKVILIRIMIERSLFFPKRRDLDVGISDLVRYLFL